VAPRRLLALSLVLALAACGPSPADPAAQDGPQLGASGGAVPVVALPAEATRPPARITPWLLPAAGTATPTADPPSPTAPPAAPAEAYPAPGAAPTEPTLPGRAAPPPTATSRAASAPPSRADRRANPTRTRAPTRTPKPTRTPGAPEPTRTATVDTSPLTLLRQGGLVIYLRHAHTDWSQNDRELEWVKEMLDDRSLLEDCDRQRLLTDEGRAEAQAIGEAIRSQGIPIGQVLSSPWCRTRETAELAFGGADVAEDKLFDTGYLEAGGEERRAFADALHGLLSEPPGGANRVVVGHMPQLNDVARISLNEGEAAVFQPEGDGFELVRRVAANGWDRLDR
jgi:phosphohistidine phosphatase SixA